MNFFIALFTVCLVVGVILAIWLNTKSGKKWLTNL